MRVFLDANILFSASDPDSAIRSLLKSLAANHALVTSEHAWEEARRNLERKRPHHLEGLRALQGNVDITKAFHMPESLSVSMSEKDIPILAAAIGSKCTHMWTSDQRHFGALYGKSIQGVQILSSIQITVQLR